MSRRELKARSGFRSYPGYCRSQRHEGAHWRPTQTELAFSVVHSTSTMLRSTAQATARLQLPLRKFSHVRCRRISLKADNYPVDFSFYPEFFSAEEQRLLLTAALQKLDMIENRKIRRRQREFLASHSPSPLSSIEGVFLPDDYYTFQEVRFIIRVLPDSHMVHFQGHYDGVIKRYREMHVSSWPDDSLRFRLLLQRLQTLHPHEPTQTHILHLASDGEILVRSVPSVQFVQPLTFLT